MVDRTAAMTIDGRLALSPRSNARGHGSLHRVHGVVDGVRRTAGPLNHLGRHRPLDGAPGMHCAAHAARNQQPGEETQPDPYAVTSASYVTPPGRPRSKTIIRYHCGEGLSVRALLGSHAVRQKSANLTQPGLCIDFCERALLQRHQASPSSMYSRNSGVDGYRIKDGVAVRCEWTAGHALAWSGARVPCSDSGWFAERSRRLPVAVLFQCAAAPTSVLTVVRGWTRTSRRSPVASRIVTHRFRNYAGGACMLSLRSKHATRADGSFRGQTGWRPR
jgi:hypothetical protein